MSAIPLHCSVPKLTSTPVGTIPRKGTYTVGIIFNPGMEQFSAGLMLMPMEAAQGFFQMGDGVTEVAVNIADPEKAIDAGPYGESPRPWAANIA